jgi:hypothetical protein
VVKKNQEKKNYENSPEAKEYEKEVNQLNEQIKKEKIMEEQRNKEMMNQKAMLLRTATTVERGKNTYNPLYKTMGQVPLGMGNNINNSPANPFSGGLSNPYNLPPASKKKHNVKLPRRKFNYSKNDKEVQEIDQMYMNYDPGEYEKVSDTPNSNQINNNNYYNANSNANIQINTNNIEEAMKKLLEGYVYPGSNEVSFKSIPVLYKSEDYYKLRLHIKSVLIPKIIGQLYKDESEEAYKNSKMLLYYLSIMNPK